MQTEVDVLIIGGGLAGVSCALRVAETGRSVLLVERRPALGWESTWAGQLDYGGDALAHRAADRGRADPRGRAARRRGRWPRVADGPVVEIALDRHAAAGRASSVLYYCYPVQLLYQDEYAYGVLLASRCGEQTVRARVIVDATEEATLWSQTGVAGRRRRRPRRAATAFL